MKLTHASWILIFLFGAIITSAQTVSQTEYEELVDEMICNFTELSLKEQQGAPHYAAFKKEIVDKGQCDYFGIRPFLRDRNPIPATTLEIVNTLHFEYKQGYKPNSTNEELYRMLMDIFDEQKVEEFSTSHTQSFPGFKTDTEGYLREYFGLNYSNVDTVINLTSEEELEEPTREPTPPTKTIVTPPNPPNPSANASNFMFWGLLLVLLAIIAYFLYGYFKNNNNKTPLSDTNLGGKTKNQYEQQIADLNETVAQHKSKLSNLLEEIEFLHGELNKLSAVAPEKFAKPEAVVEEKKPALQVISTSEKLKEAIREIEGNTEDIVEDVEEVAEESVENYVEETVEETKTDLEEAIDEVVFEVDNTNDNDERESSEEIVEDIAKADDLPLEVVNEATETANKEVNTDDIPVIPPIGRMQPETFYLPMPNEKGEFNNLDWIAQFDGNRSLYQFIMTGDDEATFSFVNDDSTTTKALHDYDKYLKPVCYPLDIIDKNASRVVTETPGQAYRENGIWKLRQKAMIYFEQ